MAESQADKKAPKKPPRSAGEIEADLAAVRSRLAADVAGLIDEVHPRRITERQIAGAKQMLADEVKGIKAQFFHADGSPRTERLVAIGAGLAGFIGFVVIVRALGSRRSGS